MSNQEKKQTKFKIIGCILIVIGLTLTIIGFTHFFVNLGEDDFLKLFWLSFIGIPLTSIGGMLLMHSLRRKITTEYFESILPKIKELQQATTPIVNEFTTATNETTITCECGKVNPSNSKFCSECGKPLT